MSIPHEYLRFEEVHDPGKRTKTWYVIATSSDCTLGVIKWYARWRQYTFFPVSHTIWNAGCLDTVSTFIREQMAARKAKVAA